jgi:hypothetical protein
MFVCFYSLFVLSCIGSGLATGWSPVQGVLPTVYKCEITEPHKEEAKARYGLERHWRRRRRRRPMNLLWKWKWFERNENPNLTSVTLITGKCHFIKRRNLIYLKNYN